MANAGGVYTWSQVATANANADNTVNYAEGQAPSTLNDAGRAVMASVAKWRDDIAGAIITTGTATAYVVSSNQQFDTLAHLAGQVIAFTPHVTNGAGPVTLNVDSLGTKALRSAPNTELLAGTLVQGTPYLATYNNTDGAFYLHGFYGASPYLIPLGGMIDFIGASAPNSQFALPFGQAISRTTYASLFSLVGTTFGSGDGSTTFNVPDLRGRVLAGLDNMGGSAAGNLNSTDFGATPTSMGAVGGAPHTALGLGHLPTSITSSGSATVTPTTPLAASANVVNQNLTGGGAQFFPQSTAGWSLISSISGSASVTSNNTGSNAAGGAKNVPTIQPTLLANKILRII